MTISTRNLGRWWLLMAIVCLAVTMIGPRSATAQGNQFGAPSIRRPTTSPYLNLFRDNNNNNRALNFGLNYQRLVRPEQDLRNYSANLNTQVGTLEDRFDSMIAPDGSLTVPGTGHRTSFMNTGGYFSSGGGAGSGARGSGRSGSGGSGGGGAVPGSGYAGGAGGQGRGNAGSQGSRSAQSNLYNRGVGQGSGFGSRSGGIGSAPSGRQGR